MICMEAFGGYRFWLTREVNEPFFSLRRNANILGRR